MRHRGERGYERSRDSIQRILQFLHGFRQRFQEFQVESIGIRNAVQTIQHVVVLRESNGPFHDEFDEFGDFALELGLKTCVDSHE